MKKLNVFAIWFAHFGGVSLFVYGIVQDKSASIVAAIFLLIYSSIYQIGSICVYNFFEKAKTMLKLQNRISELEGMLEEKCAKLGLNKNGK